MGKNISDVGVDLDVLFSCWYCNAWTSLAIKLRRWKSSVIAINLPKAFIWEVIVLTSVIERTVFS